MNTNEKIKVVSADDVADLCTRVENYGKAQLEGKGDAEERSKIASEIVDLEKYMIHKGIEDSYTMADVDPAETFETALQNEPKKLLTWLETKGQDMADYERYIDTIKNFTADDVADLCTRVENYGTAKLNGKDDVNERKEIASEIVKLEEFLVCEEIDDSHTMKTIDSAETLENSLQNETKKVLNWLEAVGHDVHDYERAKIEGKYASTISDAQNMIDGAEEDSVGIEK